MPSGVRSTPAAGLPHHRCSTDLLIQAGLDPDHLQPGSVGLAGDWHGTADWSIRALEAFAARGVRLVLHVGDFGLWPPEGDDFLRAVDARAAELDVSVLVTPGNHENWGALDQAFTAHPGRPLRVGERIFFLPRGFRFCVGRWGFGSLGGAPSIDVAARTPGMDWWPGEAITDRDVADLVADGPLDILLTHDSPDPGTPAVQGIVATNPLGFGPSALRYAASGRLRVTRAWEGTAPRLLVHGHYHSWSDTGPGVRRVLALDREHHDGNLAVADLSSPPRSRPRTGPFLEMLSRMEVLVSADR